MIYIRYTIILFKIIIEIRDNYVLYNTLLKERKSIFDQVIEISKVNNNANILEKKVNYQFLDKRISIIKEELIAASMHPKRIMRYLELGGEIDDF